MNEQEVIERGLTPEELDDLHTPLEEFDDLTEYSKANEEWYNECVYTAARLFVEAAQKSDRFRDAFVADEQRESDKYEYATIDVWREVMQEEVPEKYEKVMGIGLSAFQGGSAESTARKALSESRT